MDTLKEGQKQKKLRKSILSEYERLCKKMEEISEDDLRILLNEIIETEKDKEKVSSKRFLFMFILTQLIYNKIFELYGFHLCSSPPLAKEILDRKRNAHYEFGRKVQKALGFMCDPDKSISQEMKEVIHSVPESGLTDGWNR